MRLIDSEKYYQDLQRRSDAIKEDSVMKQGIKTGLRLAMDRLAKTEPIWEKQSSWNSGKPEREGKHIVRYGGVLIEGFFYKGVLYGKQVGGKSMVRLVPDRVGGWLDDSWPEMLHDGFAEGMRVLEPNGTLVFKWSEHDIPAVKVWKAIGRKPLFGTHSGKKMQTFFGVFMKFED